MEVKVIRDVFTDKSTIGSMYIDGKFQCYTLEDTTRENGVKVYGETSIPFGRYNVTLRQDGTIYEDYKKRYADIKNELGTLWIRDIPGYEYVLIHIGNFIKDTLGCILVGMRKGKDEIKESTYAYKKIYPTISEALVKGEKVTIEIIDGRKV